MSNKSVLIIGKDIAQEPKTKNAKLNDLLFDDKILTKFDDVIVYIFNSSTTNYPEIELSSEYLNPKFKYVIANDIDFSTVKVDQNRIVNLKLSNNDAFFVGDGVEAYLKMFYVMFSNVIIMDGNNVILLSKYNYDSENFYGLYESKHSPRGIYEYTDDLTPDSDLHSILASEPLMTKDEYDRNMEIIEDDWDDAEDD